MWLSLVYDNHNVKTYEYRLIVNSSYPENRSELVYSSAKWLAPKYFMPWLMPLSGWFRELHEVGVSLFGRLFLLARQACLFVHKDSLLRHLSWLEVPIMEEKVEEPATKLLGKEMIQRSRFCNFPWRNWLLNPSFFWSWKQCHHACYSCVPRLVFHRVFEKFVP